MDTLRQDLRFAVRQLMRNPVFATVTLVTIAIGIGANTAIFSVLNSVLLRPLPFEQPEELVQIQGFNPEYAAERQISSSRFGINVLNYDEYRERSSTMAEMGYLTPYADQGAIQVGGGLGPPEEVLAWSVSPSLFATLGVQPMLGRVFLDEERAPPGDFRYTEVAILSHRLWQRRFGADPDIVGRTISLDAGPATVLGVMPPGFDVPPVSEGDQVLYRRADVYLPIHYQAYQQPRRFRQVAVIARLAPGVSFSTAQSEMNLLASGLQEAYPEDMSGWSVIVTPLHAALAVDYGGGLYLLMAAVGLVLLIVCGNVASLLAVRGGKRAPEFAVRAAIGAGRARMVRLLLTETMLITLVGGMAGVMLSLWATELLVGAMPSDVPRASESGLDGRVLAFAAGLSLITGVLVGTLPALRASGPDLAEGLKLGIPGRSTRSVGRLGAGALVGGQMAVAVVLLIGAGMLAKSFLRLKQADPGYASQGVLVADVKFGAHHALTSFAGNAEQRTPEREAARLNGQYAFTYNALESIEALPGVEVAAVGSPRPMSGNMGMWPLRFEDSPDPTFYTLMSFVTPGYLETMGIPLVRGQLLPEWDGVNDMSRYRSNWSGSCDGPEAYCVVLVSETLASTVWPGEDPIGKRIGVWDCCQTVIGVVGDVTSRGVDDPALFREFDTAFHVYTPQSGSTFFVRTTGDPTSLARSVREVLTTMEPEGVVELSSLQDDIAASLARPRFYMALIGLFAIVAVGLAMLGLYGVIAHTVGQRTREIGLRKALGAKDVDVLWMVVREGMIPPVVGVLAGIAAATALSWVLSDFLYGMEPLDPIVFVGLGAALVAVGAVATWLPAWRASRVAPMESLRYE
jgi:predicted permease